MLIECRHIKVTRNGDFYSVSWLNPLTGKWTTSKQRRQYLLVVLDSIAGFYSWACIVREFEDWRRGIVYLSA